MPGCTKSTIDAGYEHGRFEAFVTQVRCKAVGNSLQELQAGLLLHECGLALLGACDEIIGGHCSWFFIGLGDDRLRMVQLILEVAQPPGEQGQAMHRHAHYYVLLVGRLGARLNEES